MQVLSRNLDGYPNLLKAIKAETNETGKIMKKYMLTWTVKPQNQRESLARWKSRGPNPPPGIKVVSHYWNVNLLGGWAVVEATDHGSVAKWLNDWTDLNVNDVTPIVEDSELHAAIG